MKARVRDYNSLVRRLEALPPRVWKVRQVGEVWGYPWFFVGRRVGAGAPTVLLTGRTFLFSIEFHEDVEASGYYLYELRREPPFVGEKIVRAVEAD